VHVKDDTGTVVAKKYRLNQPIVLRVLSPEEQRKQEETKAARLAAARDSRHAVRPVKTGARRRRH
jgi:hypothetical protein